MSSDEVVVTPDLIPIFKTNSRKKAPSKVEAVKAYANDLRNMEVDRGHGYITTFLDSPTFNLQELVLEHSNTEFPATIEILYSFWQEHRDSGFQQEFEPLFILRKAWEAAKASPCFEEVCADIPEEKRYISWITGEYPEDITLPEGWPGWNPCDPMESQPAMLLKAVRVKKSSIPDDEDAAKALKPKKAPKAPKEVLPMDLRSIFDRRLQELDLTTLTRPWMQTKALRLITTVEELRAWADRVLSDPSLRRECAKTKEVMPAVAVDTETFGLFDTSGLDVRIVNGQPQVDVAGICLSADGIEGLYVPISHVDGVNVDREAVRAILQEVFDQSLLLFFNSKFDREILRITMGITFRPYPYFEDVQILHFQLDPKADLEEEVSSARSEGLKSLAKQELDIDQIELDEIAKIRVPSVTATGKKSTRLVLAPFNWIPTPMAVLYAAADGITTWMLWEKKRLEARKQKWPHHTDHDLVDALAWIERQRPLIDVPALLKTRAWHQENWDRIRKELAELVEIEDFNPGSPDQVARVLFEKYKFTVTKRSAKTGKASTDDEVIQGLLKMHPNHPFLEGLVSYKEYGALHPDHLHYDVRDHTARMFFKQCTVAGGRLAAAGGAYLKDGGFGMNPQAIKKVGGNHWVTARRLHLEDTEDLGEKFDPHSVSQLDLGDVHTSCLSKDGKTLGIKGVINNHLVRYCGEWWSIAKAEDSILISGLSIPLDKPSKVDANEVINLRALFIAPEGYTYFTTDYSNIEMRVAANVSKEPKFIDEFLTGSGDFHTLTAKGAFPEFLELQERIKELKHQDPAGHESTIQGQISEAKAKMKFLRGLAKIINFALLYGGTDHAIYKNMVVEDPTITPQRAKAMVEAYWRSVPKFDEWATTKRIIAKDTLTCTTTSGRKIDFRSAMKTMRITEPTTEHRSNARVYWDLKKQAEKLIKFKRQDEADVLLKRAQEMILNKDTGVANVGDYNKFIGKIQRVATNVPLQGLAGDIMRKALCLLHQWAIKTGLGDIFLLHSTVHDEIDFSVKDDYVPYVVPRVNRIMKLRKMHAQNKWPVPIECDCEYGKSWDVKEHLTGDDTHSPAGWTKVPGLERYIPSMFDPDTVKAVALSLCSTDKESREEGYAYLKTATHPRCHINITKLDGMGPREVTTSLIAILQLHEYWTIEEQDEEDPNDESMTDYQIRMGLAVGETPTRPEIVLIPSSTPLPTQEAKAPVVVEPIIEEPKIFGPPKLINGLVQTRDLTETEALELYDRLGIGSQKVTFVDYLGRICRWDGVACTEIPPDFLVLEQKDSPDA